jgi:phosphoribosyl 1,2-cyclic phosphodiesterase
VLSSGSGGNCVYIETGTRRILIDAGLSEKKIDARMAAIGRDLKGLDAVFVTHEHSDHMRGVGPLCRKHNVPLYCTEGTLRRMNGQLGRLPGYVALRAEEPIVIGNLRVVPYATPHDAEEPVAFVLESGGRKLGHATDLGRVTAGVVSKLQRADALMVEANHDVDMLHAGPYPWSTKKRIQSDVGHLSNEACAELLAATGHGGLKTVVLMHLSETNNHPDIAAITARQALGDSSAEMILARQDRPTPLIEIHPR